MPLDGLEEMRRARDRKTRRTTWADEAHQWCRVELGDAPPAAELATCVAHTIECIASLAPRIGDSSMVVYLGNPCSVTDPRPGRARSPEKTTTGGSGAE